MIAPRLWTWRQWLIQAVVREHVQELHRVLWQLLALQHGFEFSGPLHHHPAGVAMVICSQLLEVDMSTGIVTLR